MLCGTRTMVHGDPKCVRSHSRLALYRMAQHQDQVRSQGASVAENKASLIPRKEEARGS